ncbi:GNAT family N-acetyltransferase [Luteolibacter sp. Populi]|uniref:GNAT family N-acetyltransferase n=1 Tax=Luteolibacter sp. Populi TaxID=3230487 RepID=UPI003467D970
MGIEIHRATGKGVLDYLEDAARLRIEVFREFPYLYEGDVESEREYLGDYGECPRSVFVLAIGDGKVVGVSTGLPLAEADESFQAPFIAAGMPVAEWFYCGESVLERAWRGKGIGHRFFDEREGHARDLGLEKTCFCSVARAADHPQCPAGYRSNDVFWSKRGYVKQPGLRARFGWKQVDSGEEEVANELVFWTREG